MALLDIRELVFSYGGPPIIDGAGLRVERGDRVCVFGRNGEGKSTFLKLVCGALTPDHGVVDLAKGASIGFLEQEVPSATDSTVLDVVTEGLGSMTKLLGAYQRAVAAVSKTPTPENLEVLEKAQAELEAADGWAVETRVETVMTRLGLDGERTFAELSGGWRRRVFLARALVSQPDILVLDEPTNHLDVEAIEWLEELLARWEGALLFVTHDRRFLRRVANRIVEIELGAVVEYPGDFDGYLQAKDEAVRVQAQQERKEDRLLVQEEQWVRSGIKARRTRSQDRVNALVELRARKAARRKRQGTAAMTLQSAERSGALVVETTSLGFSYGENVVIRDLDLRVKRGDRIGLIGPNGAGKTTLLKLLVGELEPSSGTVELGTRLQPRYYDQMREELDEDKTVAQNVIDKGDTVIINERPRHIVSYLRDFLFDGVQAGWPVSVLSGGERNRLLLARLFSQPANLLILDEPTNDLDMETLEVLEDRLESFDGTVLLVSHDRAFLDSVVTECLVFEGDGVVTRLVGGYDAWEGLRDERRQAVEAARREAVRDRKEREKAARAPSLSYAQKQELAELPAKIEGLEEECRQMRLELQSPQIYAEPTALSELSRQLEDAERQLEEAYERWAELEELAE